MGDRLDVLVVTQFFPPESMGGAHRWKEITAHVDESVEPHVLCTFPTFPYGEFDRQWRPISRETVDGVPITRLFTFQPLSDSTLGRILNYGVFSLLSSLYVLLTFWRYDCIVTVSAPHTTFLPGLVGKLTGRAWVIDIFDLWIDNAADLGYIDDDSIPYRLVSALERVSFAESDAVFVITDTMREYYENKYPDIEFETHVIPFGVDTDTFSPAVDPIASTDVIYTGNLGTGQAFVPFLKGFAELEGEPMLTIVGDGERRDELEALVDQLDIADRVSFEGYVPRSDIPGLLAGADVSLVPLKTEYQLDYARPTKLLETMAVGTPYVASAVTEIADLSQEHETGFAVENDASTVCNALQLLLDEDDRRAEMGNNSVEFIETHHQWGNIGDRVSGALKEMTDVVSEDVSSNYIIKDPPQSELTSEVVDPNSPPLVSFVIPCYNDADILSRCLRSIRRQQYPSIEIIVVDNGSTDGSTDIAEQFADQVLHVDGPLGRVRQKGFEAATGEIIGSFDSDNILPHAEWLSNAIPYFNYDESVANVWPKNIGPPNSPPFSRIYWGLWEEIIEDRIANSRGVFGGGTSLFRHSAIMDVGGIDANIHWGEDFDLALKLKNAGYSVIYITDPVYHKTDMGDSIVQFTRKQFLGAEAFADNSFGAMSLSPREVVYEQFVLGGQAMLKGLYRDRDHAWFYFPIFIGIRSIIYSYALLKSWVDGQR